MVDGVNFRYILLCRHGRHREGNLVPVKDSLEQWAYPTDAVGRVLAEVLATNPKLRLGKVAWAQTDEAKQTAALLLNRLAGQPGPEPSSMAPALPDPELPALPADGSADIAWPPQIPRRSKGADSGPVGETWPRTVLCESPGELSPATSEEETRVIATDKAGYIANAFREMASPDNALLIVGHQPQLGQLSACLTGRRLLGMLRAAALPLSSSEILCLATTREPADGRWKLLWAIAPDDSVPLAELAEKVKGKMESAKLLSAVITLALTALLGALLDSTRWQGLKSRRADLWLGTYDAQLGATIAFILLLTALAIYLVTMYGYDRLLMPTRFWGESSGKSERPGGSWRDRRRRRIPRRPPSSSAWVVYRNMQLLWFALFTPANVLVAVAFVALGAPLLGVSISLWWLGLPALAAVVSAWIWWWRPELGSED